LNQTLNIRKNMKRIRNAILAISAVAMLGSTLRANTITPSLAPLGFVPGVSITYNADHTSGELHPGDGFTIFDIGGFTGYLGVPAGWVALPATATGSPWVPPAPGVVGDSGDANVHFEYVGRAVENLGAFTFFGFVVGTTSTTLTVDDWRSADHEINTIGPIDGVAATVGFATIVVPAHVPDGGSTIALLGAGVFALGFFRRKIKALIK
jgi:hypothetical protein